MKINHVKIGLLALALGLAASLPFTARADSGIVSQTIAAYQPVKPGMDLSRLKAGDLVVKVCKDCHHVTLIRIVSVGQGPAGFAAEKCAYCGSMNTYFAVPDDKTVKK